MRIAFRVDASLTIGSGHVMRCLTLARFLKNKKVECKFICRAYSGNFIDYIQSAGFEVVTLPHLSEALVNKTSMSYVGDQDAGISTDWQSDLSHTADVLSDWAVDWLIVDHYGLDSRWEGPLRLYAKKIMVIDDLADRNHECDLLLDQNLVTGLEDRYNAHIPSKSVQLLGPKYALLQPQYADLHPQVSLRRGPVKNILVAFGGADLPNLTGQSVLAFLSLQRSDITIDVVLNPKSPHASSVRSLVEGKTQITVHEMLPSLAPLMQKADLAIGASGATSWERCCMGLPSLVVTLAENQRPIAATLNQQGYIFWIDHFDRVTSQALKMALKEVIDCRKLEDWSRHCKGLVDGKGVARVVSIMTLHEHSELKVRLAEPKDEDILLNWANDPLVRRNAFFSEEISPEVHHHWLVKRLRNQGSCLIYIIEAEENFSIGQVRFEMKGEDWVIGYSLDSKVRGKNLAVKMLRLAIIQFQMSKGIISLVAHVKNGNEPSKRTFQKLDFLLETVDDERIAYKLTHKIA